LDEKGCDSLDTFEKRDKMEKLIRSVERLVKKNLKKRRLFIN